LLAATTKAEYIKTNVRTIKQKCLYRKVVG